MNDEVESLEIEYGQPDKTRINSLLRKGEIKKVPKKGCGCINKCPHTISNSVGELVIVVTRQTYVLPVALPYCIWGTLYVNSNYGIVLQPYLPPGITLQSNTITPEGNMLFTYQNGGGDTDTILVSVPTIGLINYVEILSGLKTNYMRSCFMTFDCNSANDADTLDNSVILDIQSFGLFFQKVGGTGDKGAQLIIPKTRRQINNSVMNIIEIYLRNEPIKPETVWVHSMPYIVAIPPALPKPQEYNFTVFITETVDINAKV